MSFLIIKRNLLPVLAKPIDGGLQLGQKRLFGDSKTWRGFIAMAFLTGIIFWLFSVSLNLPLKIHPLSAGILLGLAYSLGELPNSFVKRMLGLKEGSIAKGPARLLQHLFDQTDSIIGARAILDTADFPTALLGHVGDGNFHAVLLIDPANQAEVEQAERLNDQIVRLALSMDGTCTGEHGIGLHKIGFLIEEAGEDAIDLMRGIKRAFDPDGILNPGKIFRA